MRQRFLQWMAQIEKLVSRPWYVPLVALFAGLDSFVLIFPVDAFLITRILFRKEGWLRSALIIATGSALGALFLALFVNSDMHAFSHRAHSSSDWSYAAEFIRRHGTMGVALVSLSFIPLPIAVVVAAWQKVPVGSIFLAAWAGRAVKYSAYAFACAYFPDLVKKWMRKV